MSALDKIIKSIKKEELEAYVSPVRRLMKRILIDSANAPENVPTFSLPKGLTPILTVFLQGLMYGPSEVREQAALGIGIAPLHVFIF